MNSFEMIRAQLQTKQKPGGHLEAQKDLYADTRNLWTKQQVQKYANTCHSSCTEDPNAIKIKFRTKLRSQKEIKTSYKTRRRTNLQIRETIGLKCKAKKTTQTQQFKKGGPLCNKNKARGFSAKRKHMHSTA